MTRNFHVCTIRFRPEVVYAVIYAKCKDIKAYLLVNCEVVSSNNFRDIKKQSFRDGGGGGGGYRR